MATELENGLRIRIGLELRTNRGLQSMVGPVYEVSDPRATIDIAASQGIISYPDQRVTKFRIYACRVTDMAESVSLLKLNIGGTNIVGLWFKTWTILSCDWPNSSSCFS